MDLEMTVSHMSPVRCPFFQTPHFQKLFFCLKHSVTRNPIDSFPLQPLTATEKSDAPTFEISIPITVSVLKRPRVDLVNRAGLPPTKALWGQGNDSNSSCHKH